MNNFDNVTPKKIGNFNVPKNVIECKIDTLAFLEVLLRKNICTWEEIEEIREAVVMHLNVIFPELQLSYSTPQPLKDEAPITPPDQPQKPLYYTANPTDIETVPNQSSPQVKQEAAPRAPEVKPLFHTAAPKVMGGNAKPSMSPIRPLSQNIQKPIVQNQAAEPAPQDEPQLESAESVNENPTEVAPNTDNQQAVNTPPQTQAPQQQTTAPVNPAANQPRPLNGQPAQKPMFPTAGPPKILNAPPRKKL
ncbi:hypothetical protein EON78_07660 [bacterium]|nr:MAG: hypothetical protein EON78_07660 [bacterium]